MSIKSDAAKKTAAAARRVAVKLKAAKAHQAELAKLQAEAETDAVEAAEAAAELERQTDEVESKNREIYETLGGEKDKKTWLDKIKAWLK